jgi:hypothetical protein
MKQLEFDFPKPYKALTGDSLLSPLKTPTIGFDVSCPNSFTMKVLQALSAGLITIKDYQGNELKVKVY